MPGGHLVAVALGVLVASGWLDGILARWRITAGQVLFWLFVAISGSLFDLTITRGPPSLVANAGGALVPAALWAWIVARSRAPGERARAIVAPLVAGVACWAVAKLQATPSLVPSAVAALAGYGMGRSPRAALVGGAAGVLVAGFLQYVEFRATGIPGRVWLGGGPAYDATVLAGAMGAALAEGVRALRRGRPARVR